VNKTHQTTPITQSLKVTSFYTQLLALNPSNIKVYSRTIPQALTIQTRNRMHLFRIVVVLMMYTYTLRKWFGDLEFTNKVERNKMCKQGVSLLLVERKDIGL